MASLTAPELLHIVGYVTGASLYAMLLAMVVRTRGPVYRLMLGAAALGLAWNLGELTAHALDSVGLLLARDLMSAASYAALGFLAAVAVHAAGRGQGEGDDRPTARRATAFAGYLCAAIAGIMQVFAAFTNRPLPWSMALVLLTVGLAALSAALLLTTRRHAHGGRAVWMTALALFAVSALHLGQFHGASESWFTELLGHHASIPLAFAILYQDFRFAFADLFLKRALTLIVLVAIVFVAWSALAPSLTTASAGSPAIGALLVLWIGSVLMFPWMRRQISRFVDHIVLKRADYATVLEQLTTTLQRCDSPDAVVARTCEALGHAVGAASVTWRSGPSPVTLGAQEMAIPMADDPQYVLTIGLLTGGRRLLSDDVVLLERAALLAGRRIDALRLSDERYERMLREREISTLAAEAELRALRAQINPHFLFNALTTIGYLIQSAPSRAFDTLMRLTTLLRSVLRSEGEFTVLGHERDLIECYLQIERERFEERLDARIEIPDHLGAIALPSLIVQPLVENAIKHGIAHARDGGLVRVVATLQASPGTAYLRITVRNTGAPLGHHGPSEGSGIGLQNVRRRLRCYYGDEATLTLTSRSGETVAEINIPVADIGEESTPALVEQSRR
jgi:two-component system, LytTR family, sensor kinase